MKVAAAILAAGASRRLGRPKQLVPFRGVPLVEIVARALLDASALTHRAVVVGASRDDVVAVLSGLPLSVVVNDGWDEGVASSVRAAARWASSLEADALVVVTVDQPLLSAAHLEALVTTWREGAAAVGSAYDGIVGVPAVFDRAFFASLLALEGDRGAGRLLRDATGVASIAWPDGSYDIDTAADVARLGD